MGRDTLMRDLEGAQVGDVFIDTKGEEWRYDFCKTYSSTWPHHLSNSNQSITVTRGGKEWDEDEDDSEWVTLSHKKQTKPTNIKRADAMIELTFRSTLQGLTSDSKYILIDNLTGAALETFSTREAAQQSAQRRLTQDSEYVILKTECFIRPKPIDAEFEEVE